MPRGSSRGSSAYRPAASGPVRRPPQPAAPVSPPPAPSKGGNGSVAGGLGASIVDGMAFGTGNAFAHRVVDSLFGPRVLHHEVVASPIPSDANSDQSKDKACGDHSKAMIECLNNNASDIGKCQFFMDMLRECKASSGAMSA